MSILRDVAEIVIVNLAMAYIYLIIGGYSLKYYAAKHQVSREALETFLNQLKYPLDRLYVKKGADNFVTMPKIADPIDSILSASRFHWAVGRVLWSFVPALLIAVTMISALAYPIHRFVYAGSGITLLFGLILAWRFGHQLGKFRRDV